MLQAFSLIVFSQHFIAFLLLLSARHRHVILWEHPWLAAGGLRAQ